MLRGPSPQTRCHFGILRSHLSNAGGIQVLCDLIIALTLVCSWMRRDAKLLGRTVWPFLVATLFLGSFGPLLYLLLRPRGYRGGVAGTAAAGVIQ
jgi:hypothetical protein